MDNYIEKELCEEIRKYYHDRPHALNADIRVAVKLMAVYKAYTDLHNPDELEVVNNWVDKPEELYAYWDAIGWIDPAIELWNFVGGYNLNDDTDTAHIFVGQAVSFISDYMAVHFRDYSADLCELDRPLRYKFSCSGDDEDWDDYTDALFLAVNWLVCMLDLYPDKIKNWRDK